MGVSLAVLLGAVAAPGACGGRVTGSAGNASDASVDVSQAPAGGNGGSSALGGNSATGGSLAGGNGGTATGGSGTGGIATGGIGGATGGTAGTTGGTGGTAATGGTVAMGGTGGAPSEWTCDWQYYGDGACDCGCGVADPDCADLTVQSCAYCSDVGSCSFGACPGTIDPTHNEMCTGAGGAAGSGGTIGGGGTTGSGGAGGAPSGWTCNWQYYGDSACDCGCGVADPDCADLTVQSCAYCDDPGSCSFLSCPGTIDPAQNTTCVDAAAGG